MCQDNRQFPGHTTEAGIYCNKMVGGAVVVLMRSYTPDSKVHGAGMGSIWGRQDPGGPHVGPMDFAI